MPATAAPRIAALRLYPVKSCRGLDLDRADLAPTGLAFEGVADREWMVVDADGEFLTQREHPRLALVSVAVADGALVLRAPGVEPLAVAPRLSASRPVTVWESAVRGFDAGDEAADMLSALLGTACRLVRYDRAVRRPCDPGYAGDSGAHTFFADGYPVLVAGSASLADLNARLAAGGTAPLPMDRFRPNVVVDGLEPYDEDHLETLEVAGAVLRLVKRCTRCPITTTDQATGERGLEPLPTLAAYRRDETLRGVTFGVNAVVLRGGALRVGDAAKATFRF